MPVTVHPAPHGARKFLQQAPVGNSIDFFKQCCPSEQKKVKDDHIIQSSFCNITAEDNIHMRNNGFVDTAVKAYNEHLHLEIRPEDVWFSILSQLSIYVNIHAEELRGMFVAHEGQKELKLLADDPELHGKGKGKSTWHNVDFGKFTYKVTKLLDKNIKDPSLKEWILPQFTTTTKVDQAVASILMMATFQKYFTYVCCMLCGLPSVTLLGQKSDWEKLALKAERLPTFGEEPTTWYGLLKPVLSRFVSSFDNPDGAETKDFWQKISHYSGGGSGPTYLSGWITAFCFWDNQGKSFVTPASTYKSSQTPGLRLDEARYHYIETTDVPRGWATVPVILDDDGVITETVMVAGSVGFRVRSSGKDLDKLPGKTGLDTVSPESGWWMYEKLSEEDYKAAKEARHKEYKEQYGRDPYDSDENQGRF